jgi:para-nitrobenzyl esterase
MRVETNAGTIEGRRHGRVRAWLGVPFAAPPIGPRRFAAPAGPEPWAGVRAATEFGAAPVQARPIKAPAGVSEDCLYLNVWSPTADAVGRPVLVWIHGGGFTIGNGAMFNGAGLAAAGDIVVVTVNYRLGVFGFVDVGAVGIGSASNPGLRDQIAALQWVQANIAGFGGDPRRVTVAGQSAGAVSISLLLTAPSAAGLFRSAIMESGSYSLAHSPKVAAAVAESYARELGSSDWQQIPAERLLAAQRSVGRRRPGALPAAPWFDGDLVPASLEAARAVPPPDVALLAGHNRDEITLFRYGHWRIVPVTRAAVSARLVAELGPESAVRLLELYPDTRRDTEQLAGDLAFARPTQIFAERHAAAGRPTYFYRFDARRPLVGAMHGSELPYVWGWQGLAGVALAGPRTAIRRALAARVREHWIDFVTSGGPGSDWTAYDLPARNTMILDTGGDRLESDPDGARRAAWAGIDVPTEG